MCKVDFGLSHCAVGRLKGNEQFYRDPNLSATADESFDTYPPESPTERTVEHSRIIRQEIREEEPEPIMIKPAEKDVRPIEKGSRSSENGPRKAVDDRPASEVFICIVYKRCVYYDCIPLPPRWPCG